MYKLILFLKKTEPDSITEHFKDYTIKYLSDIAKEEIKIGTVESSLLLDRNYSLFAEFNAKSKDEMDSLMNSTAGKKLTKDLADFNKKIDIVFINYNN